MTKIIYKRIYSSNEIRYLALLSKKNRLPKHLHYTVNQGLEDIKIVSKKI